MALRLSSFANRLLLPLFVLPLIAAGACSSDPGQCADGEDNDGDGLIDIDDTGCLRAGGTESPDATECEDQIDNDEDGLIDLADPGCDNADDKTEYNEPRAQCSDGIDNDSDGLVDYPNDPGCDFSLSDSEEDGCPDTNCPDCSNGIDDDEDGTTDYPDDLGCNSAGDSSEINLDPSQCGINVLIQPLPDGGIMGQFMPGNSGELKSPECGGNGQEHVYVYTATGPEALLITTDFAETNVDTVVYVRSDCDNSSTELGCNDDNGTNDNSTLIVDRVEAGSYFVVVDTANSNGSGDYRLEVQAFTPAGEACDVANDTCITGLVCRTLDAGATMTTCELPECKDGLDNDADGLIDFPSEPGCDSPEDNTELDDCPSGPNCPACSNDIDDDADGLIDLGPDPGCTSASDDSEIDECVPGLETLVLTSAGASGTTTAGTSLLGASCTTAAGSEVVYIYENNDTLTQLSFTTNGSLFDVVLSVRLDMCDSVAAEVGCSEQSTGNETVRVDAPVQGNYFVIVDGFGTSSAGAYQLAVNGIIPLNQPCNAASTNFVCDASIGLLCTAGTCQHSQCSDGINNDADALIDFADPGCTSITDNTEAPNPTPNPQCFDGIDNDGNGLIDYPNDPGCSMASDNVELACTDTDPLVDIVAPLTTGNTSAATNDFSPSCSTSSTAKNDIVHTLAFPGSLQSLHIDTENSALDTVIYVKQGDCSQTDLACDDDGGVSTFSSALNLTNVAAGNYFIVVDGFGSGTGGAAYNLNVSGVIAAGQACNAAQVTAGIFTCAAGGACTAGVCQ